MNANLTTDHEYLLTVAKEWTHARFAAAQSSEYVPAAHRFELAPDGFRRVALAAGSPEARSPTEAVTRVAAPTVWSHSVVATLLADGDEQTLEFEQEVIEIVVMDGDAVSAEASPVIRVPGVGVCLGPFTQGE
ncbi:MAG TPA: hypothetical protein VGH67_16490 [Solirubrobacteraceae bacterium]